MAFDVTVVDRRSNDVVYRVRVWSDVELEAAQSSIRSDLARLTVSEFQREYGLVRSTGERREVSWPKRLRSVGRLVLLFMGVRSKGSKTTRSGKEAPNERP